MGHRCSIEVHVASPAETLDYCPCCRGLETNSDLEYLLNGMTIHTVNIKIQTTGHLRAQIRISIEKKKRARRKWWSTIAFRVYDHLSKLLLLLNATRPSHLLREFLRALSWDVASPPSWQTVFHLDKRLERRHANVMSI